MPSLYSWQEQSFNHISLLFAWATVSSIAAISEAKGHKARSFRFLLSSLPRRLVVLASERTDDRDTSKSAKLEKVTMMFVLMVMFWQKFNILCEQEKAISRHKQQTRHLE